MAQSNLHQKSVTAIVLAAGRGTRMRSSRPKGLQPLGGKALLSHLLASLYQFSDSLPDCDLDICVVAADDNLKMLQQAVREEVAANGRKLRWVIQDTPEGTGHAVRIAVDKSEIGDGPVFVLYSDVPLIRPGTLRNLLMNWRKGGVTLLSMELDNPYGYGRVLRDNTGKVLDIVEEADVTEEQALLCEVSTGVLVADGRMLPDWLHRLEKHEVGEYYLPDIIAMAQDERAPVQAIKLEDAREAFGANNRLQLHGLERYWQSLQANALMESGVWLADASSMQIRGEVSAGRDVFIDVGTVLEGRVQLGDGVRIGPYCVIRDSTIAAGAVVEAHSWIADAQIGERAAVGPFARIREGTRLEAGVRVGNFVETKKAHLHEGSKASHLSYLGDAEIGSDTNIGAGVITCNYDGENKHKTEIGRDAFIGSNSALVAPVKVGDGARVGAGSAITKDVPDSALAVGRGRQKNLEGRAGKSVKSGKAGKAGKAGRAGKDGDEAD